MRQRWLAGQDSKPATIKIGFDKEGQGALGALPENYAFKNPSNFCAAAPGVVCPSAT